MVHVQSAAAQTRSEWLEPLLVAARTGAAKMKKNRDTLRDLCDSTVKLMETIQHQILSYQGTTADKLMQHCKEFEYLMKDVLKSIKQMQIRAEGPWAKLQELFNSDKIAQQVNEYEKKIKAFLDHIQT
ncbi:hypothetical protein GGX14DRAFT_391131 [Mycena pura]|uniref:Uncharacterized protein n=1 Tax=Mycena pura TaxID=153505 RepID=A0AAD6VV37_9AGAR|nr:hypothetical protein GGX14DRAFT_391131 [Mycena pura]